LFAAIRYVPPLSLHSPDVSGLGAFLAHHGWHASLADSVADTARTSQSHVRRTADAVTAAVRDVCMRVMMNAGYAIAAGAALLATGVVLDARRYRSAQSGDGVQDHVAAVGKRKTE